MFLLIDNFDSFTFNLVQAFQQQGADPVVLRNDRPELLELAGSGTLSRVCISPGPSRPENAGFCLEFLGRLPASVPVLGVCLGHQILGHFAGAPVVRAERIMHGKTSLVTHDGEGLFRGVPNPWRFVATIPCWSWPSRPRNGCGSRPGRTRTRSWGWPIWTGPGPGCSSTPSPS